MWRAVLVCAAAVATAWLASRAAGIVTRVRRFIGAPVGAPASPGREPPVRIGLLGVAKVAPWALMYPSRHLADRVEVVAVGARDPARATRFARDWSIRSAGDYASVLTDPNVEAVYIPLINGLHYEWAARALGAGKHVLVEKPISSNAREARALSDIARDRGCLLVEAFHYRHHPLMHRVRDILHSGEIGALPSHMLPSARG